MGLCVRRSQVLTCSVKLFKSSPYSCLMETPSSKFCSRPNGVKSSAPSLYVHLFRKSSSPQELHDEPLSVALCSLVAKAEGGAPVVGYRAPCRYRRCTWVTSHVSGTRGEALGRP